MSISREEVLACLKTIQAPSGVDLVEAGLVRALTVTEGAVRFVMEVSTPDPFMPAKAEAEEKLTALGCTSVSIVMTAHPPSFIIAGPAIPIELFLVAIITSEQPAIAAFPAKQFPETIEILGTFPLNFAYSLQVGRSKPPELIASKSTSPGLPPPPSTKNIIARFPFLAIEISLSVFL